jgi:protein-L-isoaspartate(D-aspartate) O-methyltransferase
MDTTAVFEAEREAMVQGQLRRRGIRSERVLEAMASVPRHEFVPPAQLPAAYEDRALPIGELETISQPYIVAVMTEAAAIRPGDQVLEIGTGAGYQAAILAYLGARVYTMERNPELAEEARRRLARLGYSGVEVITGDGSQGYPPAAPYDAILVTAASPRVPQALLDQLADGGRLVIPVGSRREQRLELIIKAGDRIIRSALDACQFVPLVGKEGWPEGRPGWME